MKILITGADGQLANEIKDIVNKGRAEISIIPKEIKDSELITLDIDKLDITNLILVKKVLNEYKPNVVINCAAITNVDGCELDEDLAFKVNALGARNLAIASQEIGAKLVQVSTDYVFSGDGNLPLKEYELTSPKSVYGKTKLLGEKYVREFSSKYFIVRTAWLYGEKGHNFVYTMMRLGKENKYLNVVNDQRGNPTHANDLAYHILKLIVTDEYGVYHCTGNGECTWYEFAQEIMRLSNLECEIRACSSEEYKTLAKRPSYSSLDNMMLRMTIGDEMRGWKDALKSFVEKNNNI